MESIQAKRNRFLLDITPDDVSKSPYFSETHNEYSGAPSGESPTPSWLTRGGKRPEQFGWNAAAQSLNRKVNRIMTKIKESSNSKQYKISPFDAPKIPLKPEKKAEKPPKDAKDAHFLKSPINTIKTTVNLEASLLKIKILTSSIRKKLDRYQEVARSSQICSNRPSPRVQQTDADDYGTPQWKGKNGLASGNSSNFMLQNRPRNTFGTNKSVPNLFLNSQTNPDFIPNPSTEYDPVTERNPPSNFRKNPQSEYSDYIQPSATPSLFARQPPSPSQLNVNCLNYEEVVALKDRINQRLLQMLEQGVPITTRHVPVGSATKNVHHTRIYGGSMTSNNSQTLRLLSDRKPPHPKTSEPLDESDESLLAIEQDIRGEYTLPSRP